MPEQNLETLSRIEDRSLIASGHVSLGITYFPSHPLAKRWQVDPRKLLSKKSIVTLLYGLSRFSKKEDAYSLEFRDKALNMGLNIKANGELEYYRNLGVNLDTIDIVALHNDAVKAHNKICNQDLKWYPGVKPDKVKLKLRGPKKFIDYKKKLEVERFGDFLFGALNYKTKSEQDFLSEALTVYLTRTGSPMRSIITPEDYKLKEDK